MVTVEEGKGKTTPEFYQKVCTTEVPEMCLLIEMAGYWLYDYKHNAISYI
jgi:hypothetical protein